MRHTKEDLRNLINIINGSSKCKYGLYCAYGKCQLIQELEHGGAREISRSVSLGELYNTLVAISNYTDKERQRA